MKIISLLVLILLIVIEYLLFYKRKIEFYEDYELNYDGDLYFNDTKIGLYTEPNEKYIIDVNGTLHVKNRLCIGNMCLTKEILQKIKQLPVFNEEELCLKDDNNRVVCINKEMLGMLSGKNSIRLKSGINKTLVSTKYKQHGGFTHDDNDDGNNYSGFRFPNDNYRNLLQEENDKFLHTIKFGNYDKYADISEYNMIPANKDSDKFNYSELSDGYTCFK